MTSNTVPFKEGTVPCLQPQEGFLREQEGFCTLQKQPGENTGCTHALMCMHSIAPNDIKVKRHLAIKEKVTQLNFETP